MTKEQIIVSMTKYYSALATSGLQMNEIEAFAEWFSGQKFYVTDEILPSMFQHPKNKQLFELAAQTGVLKKAFVIKCPCCGDKAGSYMEIDKDLMPEYSRCSNGHIFMTQSSDANHIVFFTKEITANIYY